MPVDHSIPGTCSWGVETGAGWVIYSGNLRLHDKRSYLTEQFIAQAAAPKPNALILDVTNLHDESSFNHGIVSEQEVHENALAAVSGSHKLVIADFSPRDADRLLTFLQIAHDTNRKLAILPKDVYFLKTVGLLETVTSIKPQVLIPVHSQRPDLFLDALKSSGINIILPAVGKAITL